MKKVQILLSSYNGEKYIEEQLDSLLGQDYGNFSILIRDDGSSDSTREIIKRYAATQKQISYYTGENIGVINSFFDLVLHADPQADYYAFSDQDDVWLKDKVSQAVSMLENMDSNKPLLYCGRTTAVKEDLTDIRSSIKPYRVRPDFSNALVENICTGCTSLFNQQLLDLVQNNIPRFTVMHDWWLYLIASVYGEVCYDEKSYILYRQHGENEIGTKTTYYDEFIKRCKNFRKNRGNISRQAEEFKRLFDLGQEKSRLLHYVINARKDIRSRLKIIFSNQVYRQRKIDNFIFKILFLLGRV